VTRLTNGADDAWPAKIKQQNDPAGLAKPPGWLLRAHVTRW
jgi:hypothetical protein